MKSEFFLPVSIANKRRIWAHLLKLAFKNDEIRMKKESWRENTFNKHKERPKYLKILFQQKA